MEYLFSLLSTVISLAALWVSKKAYDLSVETKQDQNRKALPQVASPNLVQVYGDAMSVCTKIYPGTHYAETKSVSVPGFEVSKADYKSIENPFGSGRMLAHVSNGKWMKELPFVRQLTSGSDGFDLQIAIRPVPTKPFVIRIQLSQDGAHVDCTVSPDV